MFLKHKHEIQNSHNVGTIVNKALQHLVLGGVHAVQRVGGVAPLSEFNVVGAV